MRVAVSGTHASGKSTLVVDFLAAHRDYLHEPEPYEWMQDLHGEVSAEDFSRQLEISVERLLTYECGARVIIERSPLGFIAYIHAFVITAATPSPPSPHRHALRAAIVLRAPQ